MPWPGERGCPEVLELLIHVVALEVSLLEYIRVP